jgi:CrcB protein
MHAVLIFIGGGLGSLVRYGINELSRKWLTTSFPIGTLVSNCISSLLMGMFMAWALETMKLNNSMRLFLATGFCGGFSTFSAFSFETFELLKSGQTASALLNILLSVISCLFFIWAGYKLALSTS